ncbi:hypothetical protein CCACVL1_04888 [Corchorus capsularis]|uniref:Uncharacterized protein n=1 Tax=Corchorus capsularis TaxID=210143 RepID=A0A1R3JNW7_COCAP|nr:hypothetical protein CCACVL1_04888 [Corchorus capsularis]
MTIFNHEFDDDDIDNVLNGEVVVYLLLRNQLRKVEFDLLQG